MITEKCDHCYGEGIVKHEEVISINIPAGVSDGMQLKMSSKGNAPRRGGVNGDLIVAIKEQTGLMVGVQTPPHGDLKRYDALKKMGVNRVSFCFEIFDRERFVEVCPGKHTQYGLDRYLEAIEYCATLGPGDLTSFEPWVTNGEIIAGLEPAEKSIEAIDWITEKGAIPTVCVFRPLINTDYANEPVPDTMDMVPVFARLYDRCMEKHLPIGVAPNIHVSLVMLPEECEGLSENPGGNKLHKMKLAGMRKVFAAGFLRRLKQKEQQFPEFDGVRA